MILKQWHSFCLCAEDNTLFPQDARPCGAAFAPLVFLVRRVPLCSRGLFYIHDLAELSEPETVRCLTPYSPASGDLAGFVRAHGAGVLNVCFQNAFAVLEAWQRPKRTGLVLTLVGLGDVGGTALLALKLLGHEFSRIQIFDPNKAQCARYELELNQVLSPDGQPLPEIVICEEKDLFACDLFAFTASRGVPGLDTAVKDVRMAQYEANRAMVGAYARMARSTGFTGLFCQISDPVDHLSRSVFLQSNQNGEGEYDFSGLLPEQIQGFGLGVMNARAAYYAKKERRFADFLTDGRSFGPHGEDLVIANSISHYDDAISRELTDKAAHANLEMRRLGFKPYVAPALSSGALNLLLCLRGEWHCSSTYLGGIFMGARNRATSAGTELERLALPDALMARLRETERKLRAID